MEQEEFLRIGCPLMSRLMLAESEGKVLKRRSEFVKLGVNTMDV